MRFLVGAGAVIAAAAVIGAGVAALGPERSACGEVGDRERVVSPDGGRSAFVRCTKAGSAWLYVAEGEAERRLLPGRYGCCYRPSARVVFRTPAWSPDGRRLAVVIDDVGGSDLWAIDVRGRGARRLTSGPAHERAPHWLAGGRRITFETETGGSGSVAFEAR